MLSWLFLEAQHGLLLSDDKSCQTIDDAIPSVSGPFLGAAAESHFGAEKLVLLQSILNKARFVECLHHLSQKARKLILMRSSTWFLPPEMEAQPAQPFWNTMKYGANESKSSLLQSPNTHPICIHNRDTKMMIDMYLADLPHMASGWPWGCGSGSPSASARNGCNWRSSK